MTFQTEKTEKAAIANLEAIHMWRRPHLHEMEERFISRFIVPAAQGHKAERDRMGNIYVYVGDTEKHPVLWSCHIDTCHHEGGVQSITLNDKGIMSLTYPKRHANGEKYPKDVIKRNLISNCLGADDGAGVALLLEMIKYKIPGLYLFHRGEEKGCIGSRWLADKRPHVLKPMKYAIAFDRKGTKDLITHQCSERCCSEDFANSLADILGMGHKLDPSGMTTDTKQYTHIIPECTNLSIGYEKNHGPGETLDTGYWLKLREAVLDASWGRLECKRDPNKKEYRSYTYNNRDWTLERTNLKDPEDTYYKKSKNHFWDYNLKSWVYVPPTQTTGGTVNDNVHRGTFSGSSHSSVGKVQCREAQNTNASGRSYQQSFSQYGEDWIGMEEAPESADETLRRRMEEREHIASLLVTYPDTVARVLQDEAFDWDTLAAGIFEILGKVPVRSKRKG